MRVFLSGIAFLLILLGLVSMFSPLPGATILIAAGCALLICTNKRAANMVRACRSRFSFLNRGMIWIEDKMGEKLSGPMRSTRPESANSR